MSKYWYLIAYDIRQSGRLRRTHRFLRAYAWQLQESVFAWQGNPIQLHWLRQQLAQRINQREDDLRCYPLHPGQPIYWWGSSPFHTDVFDSNYPILMRPTFDEFIQAA